MRPRTFKEYMTIRRSGNVPRYHCWPIIGQQTVGTHTWQAVMLLLSIKPDASRQLLVAVLNHDGHECEVGDLSSYAKHRFARLREEYELAEEQIGTQLLLHVNLTHEEHLWLTFVDYLECSFFALEQAKLGHRDMQSVYEPMIPRCLEILTALVGYGQDTNSAHVLLADLCACWTNLTGDGTT